jgi:hypothetical protein
VEKLAKQMASKIADDCAKNEADQAADYKSKWSSFMCEGV